MRFALPLCLAVCISITASGSALAEPRPADVTIVHGLPGFTADVYVDDELFIDGFRPTTATEPIRLDPGTYELDIRELGAPADSDPVLSETLVVRSGADLSIVAHLDRGGDETLSVFQNRFPRIAAGRSLLLVRDVAAGPPFWVDVDGQRKISNLNFREARAVGIDPGRHSLVVRSAGDDNRIVPASDLRFEEGAAQIVYVIGSTRTSSVDLMLQTVTGLGTRPDSVLTGDGDLAAGCRLPRLGVGDDARRGGDRCTGASRRPSARVV